MSPIFDVPGYPITAIPGRSVDGWMSVDIQPKIFHTQCLTSLAPGSYIILQRSSALR